MDYTYMYLIDYSINKIKQNNEIVDLTLIEFLLGILRHSD